MIDVPVFARQTVAVGTTWHVVPPRRELTMRRRTAVVLALLLTLTFLGGARAWTSDGHRRAQESEARQSFLHQQLANKDAVLESQRRIYIERVKRLEAQVREREQEVAELRARLADRLPPVHRQ